jgi:hypothetical protein
VKANWSAGDFRKLAVFLEPAATEFIARRNLTRDTHIVEPLGAR